MATPDQIKEILILMQQMKANKDRIEFENSSLKAENASLKDENDSLKAANASLNAENASLDVTNRTMKDLIAALSEENSDLQTAKRKSEFEIRDLKSAIAKIESEKIALEKQYEYKQRTLQHASLRKLEEQSRLVKFERDRAEYAEAKFADMKAQLADAEDNFRQMAGAIMYQDH